MIIDFYKYQGTGNDFVILDNRNGEYNGLTTKQIHFLCDRRFGIGADGLMLLNLQQGYDFEMKYYNADGNEGSMCGNGGRCLVKFAFDKGIHKDKYFFNATDGAHEASIDDKGIVKLKMKDVFEVDEWRGDSILNTGSPHYIKRVTNLDMLDVFNRGREIRYNDTFKKEGINVNFVEPKTIDEIFVRTYERGVEDETYSCGTGVTAAALVNYHNELGFNNVTVFTKGGKLSVEYEKNGPHLYTNIWLCGPALKVFGGSITL
jgi:diaminopimelate epimerase